jgi:hypothetical protein
MLQLVSQLEPYKSLKLASKVRHKPSGKIYLLRRLTDSSNKGTLYLWNKDTEDQHFEINPNNWEYIVPEKLEPQEALRRLLECIHDGDRVEILTAIDELHEHIRYMGDLPVISRDYCDNDQTLWVLKQKVDDISS